MAAGPADFVAWLVERWAARGCRVDPDSGELVTIGPRPRTLAVSSERAALREAGLYLLTAAERLEWRRWYLVGPAPGGSGDGGEAGAPRAPGDADVTPARNTPRRRRRAPSASVPEPSLGLDS